MDRLNWENAFPDISGGFQEKVEMTLDRIMTGDDTIKRQTGIKTRVLLTAAVVVILGGITANATGLFKWDSRVAAEFKADTKQQDYLALKNMTEQQDVMSMDHGLAIKLVQTVQDKNFIYIALEVTAPKDIMLDKTNRFDFTHVQFKGSPGSYSFSSTFLNESKDEEPGNSRMYVVHVGIDPNTDVNGKEITLTFKNLIHEGKVILEGAWELSWTMHFNDSVIGYDLNHMYDMGGYLVLIKRVEITPLSMTVYFEGNDLEKMETGFLFRTLRQDILKGFKYKDGSTIRLQTDLNGGRGSINSKTGEFSYTFTYDKIVNVEEIESVLLGDGNIEMKLSDK